MTNLAILISLSLFGGVVALLGGVILLLVPRWSRLLTTYSVPFAAGVLLTVALLALIPEALHLAGEEAMLVTLLSFFLAFLLEQNFFALHHHQHLEDGQKSETRVSRVSTSLIVFGDSLHNWIDGIAIGAAFLVSLPLALSTAISTFLHEVPHEIGDFGILLRAGWRRRQVIMVNFLSALLTVVGALTIYWSRPSEAVLGYLLAISAGIFLYLGASDFLPQIQHQLRSHGAESEQTGPCPRDRKLTLALLLGVLVMILVLQLTPHAH